MEDSGLKLEHLCEGGTLFWLCILFAKDINLLEDEVNH